MNTAAVKKASYASRQYRGGPAPLASFEDLPSDEMDSPSSQAGNATADSDSLNDRLNDNCSTPGTILCSPISALRLDIQDTGSQITLTPCLSLDGITDDGSPCATPGYQLEGSKDSLAVTRQSTSALHLSVEGDKSLVESQRKSSWTDLFRPRSRSHSPQSSPYRLRKSSGQIATLASSSTDDSPKKKKGFLSSIFKFHDKKSSKSGKVETQTSMGVASSSVPLQSYESQVEPADKAFILASPLPTRSEEPVEVSIAMTSLQKTENEIPSQTEVLPLCLLSDFTNEVYDPKTERDNMSLESDLVSEVTSERGEVDVEAETLLAQESIDYDEYLALEGSSEFLPIEPQSQQQDKPRRQRLEITTVPIDRPRSTTPINVAPFEAFIQSSLQTNLETEKLKVLLPSETFLNRPKSPKKSHPQNWQDFCQAGLHSPRLPKRNSDDDMTPDEELRHKDSLTPSKEMWETFEVPHDNEEVTKEINLSNSSSFSSSCDSNSAGLFNSENKFSETFPSFHSSDQLQIFTDTNFESKETNETSDPSPL